MKFNVTLDKDNRIIEYFTIPLDKDRPVYDLENIPDDICSGEYEVVGNQIIKSGYSESRKKLIKEQELDLLRQKRAIVLEAFDRWEKAVLRNRELDDPYIMEWYHRILDLNEHSINNPPQRIEYYIHIIK